MTDTLKAQLQEAIKFLDLNADLVSNMRKPRADNSYGRAAQAAEDAIARIELLETVLEAAQRYRNAECDETPRMFKGKRACDLAFELDKAIEATMPVKEEIQEPESPIDKE